ncbi:(d)CMP kinase [Persicirhabdus sediminis]|uniref:Cytidylate kinase n=1 Tax=Persicirhabdus sediminis TaxID=454144 RepID=A0A8J7MGF0_9BACT|nr:(d)CMP kinase [Persicirhabdus sediminis]MBK1791344.1 (d)CMP kinase [Persicirhabdus sediminis]
MNGQQHIAVAIDGPAASGKSTVAKKLAKLLGLNMVNTGAMYRAVVWGALQKNVSPNDPAAVVAMLSDFDFECKINQGSSEVWVDGQLLESELRSDAVNANVSAIAAIVEVRELLVAKQRGLLQYGSVIMEGRDIGSVVFPDTPYKLYIDASEEVRAARRAADGEVDAVGKRDAQDSKRKVSPLIVADGATVIDSSEMTLEEVIEAAVAALTAQGLDQSFLDRN